jgi:hypothetical protein
MCFVRSVRAPTMDIETPTPPDLTNRGVPARIDAAVSTTEVDLRRPDLEAVLGEGAWQEGVDEWAQYTDLDEADVALAEEMGWFGHSTSTGTSRPSDSGTSPRKYPRRGASGHHQRAPPV